MKKQYRLLLLVLALLLTLAFVGTASARLQPLSAKFTNAPLSCSIYWFDADWNTISVEGVGSKISQPDGSYKLKCSFQVDWTNPNILSRDAFCAEDWAKFMCKANGALVDNRTTCNLDDQVHNGVIVADPSGKGMFVCNIK